jgi:S1-C subfamily serine protease
MERIVPAAPARLLCAILSVAGTASASVVVPLPYHPDLQAVADQVHGLAVQIRARAFVAEQTDGGLRVHEATSSASGVLVGDRLVLTSLGAVALQGPNGAMQPASEIEVVVDDVGPLPAQFVSSDRGLDVAVLLLPEEARDLPAASLAADDPNAGDGLLAVGVEGDSIRAIGVLLEHVALGDDPGPRLHTDHPLPPALWGGPLFDDRGHLVGITTRADDAGSTGVSISLLRPLLRRVLGGSGT